MAKFKVIRTLTNTDSIFIEADSAEEAEEKAIDEDHIDLWEKAEPEDNDEDYTAEEAD